MRRLFKLKFPAGELKRLFGLGGSRFLRVELGGTIFWSWCFFFSFVSRV